MITREEILKLAELSRLEIGDDIEKYQNEISKILGFVEKINELNLKDVEPTNHILDIHNVVREDLAKEPYSQDKVLSNTENKKDGFITVPKVI
ncbi:MAG TPA: Asp-tRNA(Asn)/Glu-tRNA(Gln) amidotransferase subunit GatC [Spirochaetota bacterium]|nr:Asp-tRNA(Asn)/Glu-tRNA(Gln) amidotransferase subunit GatC [Spirochaetota bacterium]HOM38854.1 Asp-tRNA(Asn)/Glu-tRNA(Gln) amidotransferase subunit GatC [Spirochaetota bacterium]HPQ49149.1 Asp-tRNA(Asn)/Glu-tRNA(Gln) amidotransferase subunit GatC [Spirochaetota bacterium]